MLCRFSDLPVNYKLKPLTSKRPLSNLLALITFVHFSPLNVSFQILCFLVSGVNCEVHRWILKRIFNY